jgi:hypothetical protein
MSGTVIPLKNVNALQLPALCTFSMHALLRHIVFLYPVLPNSSASVERFSAFIHNEISDEIVASLGHYTTSRYFGKAKEQKLEP